MLRVTPLLLGVAESPWAHRPWSYSAPCALAVEDQPELADLDLVPVVQQHSSTRSRLT